MFRNSNQEDFNAKQYFFDKTTAYCQFIPHNDFKVLRNITQLHVPPFFCGCEGKEDSWLVDGFVEGGVLVVFEMGKGAGKTCCGKPLKNQAPDRFSILERQYLFISQVQFTVSPLIYSNSALITDICAPLFLELLLIWVYL